MSYGIRWCWFLHAETVEALFIFLSNGKIKCWEKCNVDSKLPISNRIQNATTNPLNLKKRKKINLQFKKDFIVKTQTKRKQQNITKETLEFLYNCIIMCSHNKVFETKQIVFQENLIKDKAEKNESENSVKNHDLQKSSLACGNGRVRFFHEISSGAYSHIKRKKINKICLCQIMKFPIMQ